MQRHKGRKAYCIKLHGRTTRINLACIMMHNRTANEFASSARHTTPSKLYVTMEISAKTRVIMARALAP